MKSSPREQRAFKAEWLRTEASDDAIVVPKALPRRPFGAKQRLCEALFERGLPQAVRL